MERILYLKIINSKEIPWTISFHLPEGFAHLIEDDNPNEEGTIQTKGDIERVYDSVSALIEEYDINLVRINYPVNNTIPYRTVTMLATLHHGLDYEVEANNNKPSSSSHNDTSN